MGETTAGTFPHRLPGQPALVRAALAEPREGDGPDDREENEVTREVAVPAGARAALASIAFPPGQPRPEPEVTEFVLRALAARPATPGEEVGARAMPTAQRMFVAMSEGQWRLAVALSVDNDA